jgi:hypothetical protein
VPDLEFRNGSSITLLDSEDNSSEMNAERVTITTSGRSIFGSTINEGSFVYTPEISNDERVQMRESLMQNATMELRNLYASSNNLQDSNAIHMYNYIPEKFNFNKISNEDELYMGVELEIDCGGEDNNIAKQAMDMINKNNEIIYCKHDGSLKNGFEIVSHPCTYEYYKTINYEKMFKFLVSKGYKSHDISTCGLHVHVNRNYFGDNKLTQDLCISKLLYIFEKFWDKVEIVARRKSNGYARRFYLNDDESPLDLYVKSKDSTKYGAINLQHKNTIEIRIFKGTLKYETFMYTLEFVKKIAKLVKDTDIYDIQYITWNKLTDLFSDELNQYIIDREIQQKKEDKDELDKKMEQDRVLRNASSMRIGNISDLCISSADNTQHYYPYGFSTGSISFDLSNLTMTSVRAELTEEERINRDIRDLKQKVRRSRNGLEITNLNRQIASLENDLRRLRHSNR